MARSYNCVVCIKQVPDTAQVTGDAMKPDGTINRAALPAVFNPEDKCALEAALRVQETYGGSVTVVTMGLPSAKAILREALVCGADRAVLITDRLAAGSDTLATSYILSRAIRRLNPDLVFCGRQAIDGDTAQVGPQIGEKLGYAIVTYLQELSLEGDFARAVRNIGWGVETDRVRLPALFTVTEKFGELRPASMRRVMQYKAAEPETLSCADIGCDPSRCGRSGSPTNVHKVVSVVLAGGAFREIPPTDEGLANLVKELQDDHTIG